jgi:hypothetical protein
MMMRNGNQRDNGKIYDQGNDFASRQIQSQTKISFRPTADRVQKLLKDNNNSFLVKTQSQIDESLEKISILIQRVLFVWLKLTMNLKTHLIINLTQFK